MLWRQFRRRMDAERPYCIIQGQTEEEMRHILTTFEEIYRDQFPGLRLHRWTKPIFTWLTHRSEEHTSELQSHLNLVCRLLLEKKKTSRPSQQVSVRLTEPRERGPLCHLGCKISCLYPLHRPCSGGPPSRSLHSLRRLPPCHH